MDPASIGANNDNETNNQGDTTEQNQQSVSFPALLPIHIRLSRSTYEWPPHSFQKENEKNKPK